MKKYNQSCHYVAMTFIRRADTHFLDTIVLHLGDHVVLLRYTSVHPTDTHFHDTIV